MGLKGFVLTSLAGGPRISAVRPADGDIAEREGETPAPPCFEAPANGISADVLRLVEALSNPVLLIDANRRVLAANPPAQGVFGARIEGHDVTAFLRHPVALRAVRAATAGNETPIDVEFDWPTPTIRHFSLRISRLHCPPKERLFCLEFREHTAIRTAQIARREFIADVSHELRTPLCALSGLVDTLLDDADMDASTRRRFFAIMKREARRMNDVISALITLSHVEAEEHSPPYGIVDISAVIRQAVGIAEHRAKTAGVSLTVNIEAALHIPGEREQVLQMMVHLIMNAIQYGGTRVEISLHAILKTGTLCALIEVRDFGTGIAPEHLPRLTERFYRVDKGRARTIGGAGLGLAIVKHVVNRHRGRLKIESTAGQGSVFRIFLPLRTAAAPQGAEISQPSAAENCPREDAPIDRDKTA